MAFRITLRGVEDLCMIGIMEALTIPKKLANQGDLVLIPRRDYNRLLLDSVKTLKKSIQPSGLDKRLTKALEEVKRGEIYGPFDSVTGLRRSLRKFRNSK